jgi:hypothetical protein
MRNNRKSYRIFKALSESSQNILKLNAKCKRINVIGFTKKEKEKIIKGEPWI